MAVVSDLFKVFEIGHVFRAENANTHRHMCEFIGLDFEMEIKESYKEIIKHLSNCFHFIFEKINKHCQPELAAIQYTQTFFFFCFFAFCFYVFLFLFLFIF